MSGQDSKSKKDNSAVRAEALTDVSSKSKEEKIVATSPPDTTTTTTEDKASDQSTKTTVITDLPSTTEDKGSDQSTNTTVIIDLPSSSDASSSIESEPQNIVQPQLYAMDRSLDEAREKVLKAVEEARREIPQYTERIRSCQEDSIQFAQEIAESYINIQKEIINSMQSSSLPYWESVYALFWNGWWISPSRMIEAYATMVSSFAGNTLRATQLVNNNMLANMDAFKRTVEQTKESGNDLARA